MKYFILVFLSLNYLAGAQKTTPGPRLDDFDDYTSKIPSDLTLCHRNDPKRDECLTTLSQKLITTCDKGFPTINQPSFDPFIRNNVVIVSNDPSYSGVYLIRNVTVTGVSKGKVIKVKTRMDDKQVRMQAELFFPHILVQSIFRANYSADDPDESSIPDGYVNATLTNLNMKIRGTGTIIHNNGKNYIDMKSISTQPVVSDFKFFGEGFVPGDPVMDQMVVNMINENWRNTYRAFFQSNDYEEHLIKEANHYAAHKIPYESLFPVD